MTETNPTEPIVDDDDSMLVSYSEELKSQSSYSNDMDQDVELFGTTEDTVDVEPTSIKWDDAASENVTEEIPTKDWVSSLLHASRWSVALIGVFLFSLSILFAAAQTASFITSIAIFPTALQAICYLSLGLLWLAILIAIVAAVRLFISLRPSPKISLSVLDKFTRRGSATKKQDLVKVRDNVRKFLKEYPTTPEQNKLLARAGIPEVGTTLTQAAFYLGIQNVLNNKKGSTEDWINRVKIEVLDSLDAAADRLIKSSAMKVGGKTAVSPRGVIDSLIVLCHSWLLIKSVCQLYNLRPNAWETCIILGFTGFNTLVSDQANDATENMGDLVADQAGELVGGMLAVLAGVVAARAFEGTLNALLIHRLGQKLKVSIRPISS